ncbi:MAG: hypothetical protein IJN48_04095 [Clostridia bacterium]|nr:hypothetical protein [Clostridia bacterium]
MLKDKELIEKLGMMGILATEELKGPAEKDDIVLDYGSYQKRVIVDSVPEEELMLAVAVEQLETLKSIKSMVKFFVVLTVIGLVITALAFFLPAMW